MIPPENRYDAAPVEVRIPCSDATLDGELAIPPEAGGIVIFAHGSGSSRHSPRNQFVARVIRQSGNGTLLFDLLTAKEELEDNVTRRLRFDIDLLAGRLVEVTRWLNSQSESRDLDIGYFGSSTGGGAALVSRGGRPDLAGDALPEVQSPTLLIVGGYDDVVIQLNEEALAELRCEKQLKIVPGATHLFEEPGTLEEVAQLAAHWFREHLHGHQTGIG
jgi:putative phosphoribosyl transferase